MFVSMMKLLRRSPLRIDAPPMMSLSNGLQLDFQRHDAIPFRDIYVAHGEQRVNNHRLHSASPHEFIHDDTRTFAVLMLVDVQMY